MEAVDLAAAGRRESSLWAGATGYGANEFDSSQMLVGKVRSCGNPLAPISRYVGKHLPAFTALGSVGLVAPYFMLQGDIQAAETLGVDGVKAAGYAFQAATSALAIYAVAESVARLNRNWRGSAAEPSESPSPTASLAAKGVGVVGTMVVLAQLGFGLNSAIEVGSELARKPDAKTGLQFASTLVVQTIQAVTAKAGALALASRIDQGKSARRSMADPEAGGESAIYGSGHTDTNSSLQLPDLHPREETPGAGEDTLPESLRLPPVPRFSMSGAIMDVEPGIGAGAGRKI